MSAYLLRLKTTRQLVGLFVSDEPKGLRDIADLYSDISSCQYKKLPLGGMHYAGSSAPTVPTVYVDDPEARAKMPDWFSRAEMTDNWKSMFEREYGEKGWEDCPA